MVKNEKQVLDRQFNIEVQNSDKYLFSMVEECKVYSETKFELARIITIDRNLENIVIWSIKKIIYSILLKRKFNKLGYSMDRKDKGSSIILSFYREEWDKWIRGYLL